MKFLWGLIATCLLGACTSNPDAPPVPDVRADFPASGDAGTMRANAIVIRATNELQAEGEIRKWLKSNYPGWSRGRQQLEYFSNHVYSIVSLTSANGQQARVYFDITSVTPDVPRDGTPRKF